MARAATFVLGVCLAAAPPAVAQTVTPPATGTLAVTVKDPLGGTLPHAQVKVTLAGASAASGAGADVTTTAQGTATIEGLAPGRYDVVASFPGFDTVTAQNVRVRAGRNTHTITLPLARVAETVTVGRDPRASALDPRGAAFSTVLTREQIAALPDDPEEMEAMLKAMSPPGAMLRIDGFSGGRMPPKSQIRSIRLPRMDQMAAENHGGMTGMMFIDVMTQPGMGPLRGSFDVAFRDDALNARNPFVPVKGAERLQQGSLSFSGTLVPRKSSFSVTFQDARLFDTGSILAAGPADQRLAESFRRPADRTNINARFDHALGSAHTLRVAYQRTANAVENVGVGGFDLADRAFRTATSEQLLRVSETGPLGRRFFGESRLQLRWSESEAAAAVEAPTVRVIDAFTAGGAQRRGGSRTFDLEAAGNVDYVRGAHSLRAGVLVEGGRYRSDDETNYLGTFTFASLADFEAGRPSNFTRRLGDPLVTYRNLQVGAYVQDDYRLRKSLLLSYGLRYEAQNLLRDYSNWSPRATVSWSPFASGRTTLRAGAGGFTDWFAPGTYEQILRVDGARQREVSVRDPSGPDPGDAGTVAPTNRYVLPQGTRLASSFSANAGIDRSVSASWRVSATYTYRRGLNAFRGRNLNAPVDGVRPDPAVGNIVEVAADAGARLHMVGVNMSVIRLDWKQLFVAGNYTWSAGETNTTGPLSMPAGGDDLSAEWGMSVPRHRMGLHANVQPIRNLGVALTARAQSGMPYTILAGQDLNQDGVFNDRPAGVGRNTARTAVQWDLGLRVSYAMGFGTRAADGPGGGPTMVMVGGGGMPGAGPGGGASNARYRLEFYAAAQNVTNHRNYTGYSGVVTSPFFGQPTGVLNPRKIELGLRIGF